LEENASTFCALARVFAIESSGRYREPCILDFAY
jgi:hypothetical protein